MSHRSRDVGRKRRNAKRERVREWSKLRVATYRPWLDRGIGKSVTLHTLWEMHKALKPDAKPDLIFIDECEEITPEKWEEWKRAVYAANRGPSKRGSEFFWIKEKTPRG